MTDPKVSLQGEIEKIFSDSGAIERCPEFRRALVNNYCPVHLLPSDVIRGIFNGDKTEHPLGPDKEDANALPDHNLKKIKHEESRNKSVEPEASPINKEDRMYHVKKIRGIGKPRKTEEPINPG